MAIKEKFEYFVVVVERPCTSSLFKSVTDTLTFRASNIANCGLGLTSEHKLCGPTRIQNAVERINWKVLHIVQVSGFPKTVRPMDV